MLSTYKFCCLLNICANRHPTFCFWNLSEENIFTCETEGSILLKSFLRTMFHKLSLNYFSFLQLQRLQCLPLEKAVGILNLEEANFEGKLRDLSCLAMSKLHCICRQGTVMCDRGSSHSWTAWTQATLFCGCFLIILCLIGTHHSSCSIFFRKTYEIHCEYAASAMLSYLSGLYVS